MNIFFKIILALIFFIVSNSLFAQDTTKVKSGNSAEKKVQHHGKGFVDKNNDGFNDNAPDDDGDGIPNGLDPDYVKNKNKKKFIDLDGDGINDYIQNRRGRGKNSPGNKTVVGPQSATTGTSGQNSSAGKGQQRQKGKRK